MKHQLSFRFLKIISKFVFSGFLLSTLAILCYGQDVTHNISTAEAKAFEDRIGKKVSDSVKIDALLRLALYNILKPGELKADMDSAVNFINDAEKRLPNTRTPATLGHLYLVKSHLYREAGRRAEGKNFAQNAVDQLRRSKDRYHFSLALIELSQYVDLEGGSGAKTKIELLEKSVAALKGTPFLELKAFVLKDLADLTLNINQQDKALKNIQQSLEVYKSIGYKKLQGVYTLYGSIYYTLGNYHKAVSYLLLAQRTAENLGDQSMQICQIYNITGVIYCALSERKNGIPYFFKALNIAKINHDEGAIVLILSNIVDSYNKIGDYQSAIAVVKSIEKENPVSIINKQPHLLPLYYLRTYNSLRQFDKAKKYYTILHKMDGFGSADMNDIYNIYHELVRYSTFTADFSQAEKQMRKFKQIVDEFKDPFRYKEFYFSAFRLDSVKGNYRGAMENLLKFRRVNDSLFNESKSKQIKQFEVQYETQAKESEIKTKNTSIRLLNQKNLLTQTLLKQAKLVRNVTIAGIIFLALIVMLLIRQYKHKQKINAITQQNNLVITQKNKLLENLVKEKEWLLKEVHHRVKNNLHTVICLLESQAAYLKGDALAAIQSSEHRIYAMSLIHQKLYQTDDIKTVDMSNYLPELIRYLEESFGMQSRVRFSFDIQQINLGVSQAIPISLIVNEAVTNSFKYAFNDNRSGLINIGMAMENEKIQLIISDNGTGIDLLLAKQTSKSLGLSLMKGLTEDIEGELEFENDNGTKITITFTSDPLLLIDER
ncbi:sensor histidine kinase [Pedobacter sp. Leaf194]|uniref:tetratricopeptide repeat-containing sensor histidine kinase n=1 Tax=Pedobacter sp. Leaf194 TaxID=1736297 RepID=UPI00070260B2|nr:sensor histidine kinase [Pedobacter sp. Leaf194]KQS36198.1 hypothetical protein ASG14_12255 [Pedobacter sp. Leaf194]